MLDTLRLNIGAGNVEIEGFEPVDRRIGKEAYPLAYESDSVAEIRASHILEHFPEAEIGDVLREWVRVLKPGGRIRIAVPDFDKIATEPGIVTHPHRFAYLMGGQTDENDYHKSVWTYAKLRTAMEQAGIREVRPWVSENTDCASLPVSLNLEGVKGETSTEIKIKALMSVPRYGSLAARGIIDNALKPFGIPLDTSQGVYWGQCLQRMFNDAVSQGIDWILTLDYDSVFTAEQVDRMFGVFGTNPEMDALAALQSRREGDRPLLTCGEANHVDTTGDPFLVTTAHFGLTLIRVVALRDVRKPWFSSEPGKTGEWDDDRLDDDIWFWHQFRLAGKKIFVDPCTRIGHLEECVSYFDDELQVQRCSVGQWRTRFVRPDSVPQTVVDVSSESAGEHAGGDCGGTRGNGEG